MPEQNKSGAEEMASQMFSKELLQKLNEQPAQDELVKNSPTPMSAGLSDIGREKNKRDQSEKVYVGTKIIRATPMSESDFLVKIKGKTAEQVHQQETQGDGYKVVYDDGYTSWSPKGVFERCYRELSIKERLMM